MEVGAALAQNNLARVHQLPTEALDSESLRVGVTTISGA
jgi:hypothetical protein